MDSGDELEPVEFVATDIDDMEERQRQLQEEYLAASGPDPGGAPHEQEEFRPQELEMSDTDASLAITPFAGLLVAEQVEEIVEEEPAHHHHGSPDRHPATPPPEPPYEESSGPTSTHPPQYDSFDHPATSPPPEPQYEEPYGPASTHQPQDDSFDHPASSTHPEPHYGESSGPTSTHPPHRDSFDHPATSIHPEPHYEESSGPASTHQPQYDSFDHPAAAISPPEPHYEESSGPTSTRQPQYDAFDQPATLPPSEPQDEESFGPASTHPPQHDAFDASGMPPSSEPHYGDEPFGLGSASPPQHTGTIDHPAISPRRPSLPHQDDPPLPSSRRGSQGQDEEQALTARLAEQEYYEDQRRMAERRQLLEEGEAEDQRRHREREDRIAELEWGVVSSLVREANSLEREHDDTLAHMDELQRELRALTVQLSHLADEDEEVEALHDQRWVEAEKTKAEQEWLIKTLQEEHSSLLAEVQDREESEAAWAVTTGPPPTDEAGILAQMDDEDIEGQALVNVLREKEDLLRELEDRSLSAEEMLERSRAELESLRDEYDGLMEASSRFFSTSELSLQESQKNEADKTAEFKRLVAHRDRKDREIKALQQAHASLAARHAYLVQMNDQLKHELREQLTLREAEIGDLNFMVAETLSEEGSVPFLGKLEEVMMLLKAVGVNVVSDRQFTSEVFDLWATPEEALDGYHAAFRFLEEYIYAAYGEQTPGERWRLSNTHETRYDEVEALLSAIKQLIACYDVMNTAQKRRITVAVDVVRNASHIHKLAEDNSVKFAEMLEARAAKRREEEADRQKRVSDALKRSRLRSTKKRGAGEAAGAGAGAPASGAPVRSASALSHVTTLSQMSKQHPQRSTTPRLRPRLS